MYTYCKNVKKKREKTPVKELALHTQSETVISTMKEEQFHAGVAATFDTICHPTCLLRKDYAFIKLRPMHGPKVGCVCVIKKLIVEKRKKKRTL